MAMTAAVKDELSRLTVIKPCCRKAEAASVFRYGGSLHIVSGRIAIEAELDTGAAARRLRKDIWEVYSHRAELVIHPRAACGGAPLPAAGVRRRRGDGPADRPGRRPGAPGLGLPP